MPNKQNKKYGYFFDADYFSVHKVPYGLLEKAKSAKSDYEVNQVITEMRKFETVLFVDYCSQIL